MKKLFSLVFFVLCFIESNAQFQINEDFVIPSNEALFVGENLIIATNKTLICNGIIQATANWTNNGIFVDADNSLVKFSGSILQQVNGNTTFSNLTINNSANVNLGGGVFIRKVLTLQNGNLISNGNLKLLSDASNTAMVINTNGTVTGNATQQRYVDGTYNAVGYRYFSSPVQTTSINSVFASKMSLVCNTAFNAAAEPAYILPFPTFYFYDESQSGTTKGTIPYQYDEFTAAWQVPNSTDNMATMKGYIANIAKGQTLDFTGVLNNGALNIALTKGNTGTNRGWNLVGNPYPSPIDWSKVLALSSNVDDAIYQRIATGQYSGTWASFINGVGTNGGTDRIALGQGFLVRCNNAAGGNLVMNNTVRVGTYVNPSSFRAEENQKQALVKIALKGNGLSDETAIYFQNGATPSFDPKFDAAKVQTNAGVTLYTKVGNDKISINALPILAESDSSVIPLIFYVPNNGNYSFDLSLNCLDQKSEIYLEDKQSNKLIDLRSNANYNFSAKVGTDESRFAIKFLAPMPEINEENIIVYPNPAESDIKVRFANNYEGKISIKIFDSEGREIKNKQADSQKIGRTWEQVLNFSDLSHGLYFVQIQTEKALFSKKVVKQ